MNSFNRCNFLRTSLMGGLAVAYSPQLRAFSSFIGQETDLAQVALTTGGNSADLAFSALQPFSKQIKQSIGHKLVVIKPNNVSINTQLAASYADTLESILEFPKSINKHHIWRNPVQS